MVRKFSVALGDGKCTDVFFSKGIEDLTKHISLLRRNCMWVMDENSARLFKRKPSACVVLKPGESNKNFASLEDILSSASRLGLARDSVFIGFGGGVVCDMTALAASLYMRGAGLVLIPTTLLAMVDASVGGKTAIDYANLKNLVGTFYPAKEVLIAPETLRTLPDEEYLAGLGEVLKHAFLSENKALFDYLIENHGKIMARDNATVGEVVRLSLGVKISYIERDPKETMGIRSALNLGHTFAHARESISQMSGIKHGMAVAWGTVKAIGLSRKLGHCDEGLVDDAKRLFGLYGFDVDGKIEEEDFYDYLLAMKSDKKKKDGVVRFVLLEDYGKPILEPVDEEMIRQAVL